MRASWRDLPSEFGMWETADTRFQLWHDIGLWSQLSAALERAAAGQSTHVAL
jgi:transposase